MWEAKSTYDAICYTYVTYATQDFDRADVIFDGYNSEQSTNDMAHLKRTKCLLCQTVEFTTTMTLRKKMDEFLRHPKNKERIIYCI